VPGQPVPILIGTWGQRLCAIAGEIADEVKIGGSANPDIVPVIRRYIAAGGEQAERSAHSVGIVVGAVSVVDEDRDRARRAARRSVALYLPVVAGLDPTLSIEPEFIARLQMLANQGDWDSAASLISDDLLDRFAFSGSAHDIIEQANALYAAGARRIEFGTPHGLKPESGISLLGTQVIPALRGTWPK
jgi:5,10-methylenetetrahydromethanopterin reductase